MSDNSRSNQVSAEGFGWITRKVEVSEIKFFGHVFRTAGIVEVQDNRRVSTKEGDVVPDDMRDCAREFIHICGVLKVLAILGSEKSAIQLFLDGYETTRVRGGIVTTRTIANLDVPMATIHFKGYGTRYGNLGQYEVLDVTLSFRDRAQFEEYVAAVVPPPTPEVQRTVVREGSSMLPLAVGMVLGGAISSK